MHGELAAQEVAEDVGLVGREQALAVRVDQAEWTWHELPMSFFEGFAMKVAEIPFRKAISLTPFL